MVLINFSIFCFVNESDHAILVDAIELIFFEIYVGLRIGFFWQVMIFDLLNQRIHIPLILLDHLIDLFP